MLPDAPCSVSPTLPVCWWPTLAVLLSLLVFHQTARKIELQLWNDTNQETNNTLETP